MHSEKVISDKGAGVVRGPAAAKRANISDKIFKVGEWRGYTPKTRKNRHINVFSILGISFYSNAQKRFKTLIFAF